MATTRRTTKVPPKEKGTVASRLGGLIMKRRGVPAPGKPAKSVAVPARTEGAVGEIVDVADAGFEPFTDALSKARYETRPPRHGNLLHVSDLLGRCIRKIALVERFDIPAAPQSLSLTDALTFRQGDAIHDVLKERAARGAPAQVWGNWSCRCGVTATRTPCLQVQAGDAECGTCGTLVTNTYHEVPMQDQELGIVGTPDVILYLPAHDAFCVTELKSIAHDRWAELIRPIPDHVLQVLFYWFLMHRKGYKLTSNVSIVYATKGWLFGKSPIKEFTFDARDALRRLEPYLEDARALKAARDGGALPVRACVSDQAPEAKKCEACTICFGNTDDRPKKISIRHALTSR